MVDKKRRGFSKEFFVKCYYIFLCYLIGGELVTKPILQISHSVLHVPGKLDTVLLYAIILIIAGFGFYGKIMFSKVRFKVMEIVFLSSLTLAFLISYVTHTEYEYVFAGMRQNFAFGIISYLFFRYCDDKERLLKDFAVLSILMTLAMLILLPNLGQENMNDNTYSQYYAYMIFPACIISTNEMIRRKSILYGAVAVISFLLTFLMGGRGPVVFALLFFAIRIIKEPIHRGGKLIATLAVGGIGTYVYFNMYSILIGIEQLSNSFNLNNRIIAKFLAGSLYESGRENIYHAALKVIGEHPLTGVGIGTDRIEIARVLNEASAGGKYSHNFFIDLFVQFGIIIGAVLIVLFIIFIIKSFLRSRKDSLSIDMFWIMIMICFVPLLVSSSYITYPLFFAMLAFEMSEMENSTLRKE